MDFGKVKTIDKIDFSMPPDHPDNAQLFAKQKQNNAAQIFIGCPAWAEKSFVGKIYPLKTKSNDFLSYYSKNFATIEFNSTYYALPKPETIEKWKQQITKDFVVCPKVPYAITHEQELVEAQEATKRFAENALVWQEHLGIAFLVLPPKFGVDKSAVLCAYVNSFPSEVPLSIEFRDRSWFKINTATRQTFSFLEEHRVSTVITDVAGRRDCLHQRVTTDRVVIRFVGNDLHPTDYQRLDDWAVRLGVWISQGLSRVYFFIHEPSAALAVGAALYFIEKLQVALPDMKIKKPQPIVPVQVDIQQTFFEA